MPLWAANHYIDNAASGGNDGTSWTDAWESFADIVWASIDSGDTVYISGGSTSKYYYEQLTAGKSFSSLTTITKGTDSGHNGTVIIDGADTRSYAYYNSSKDYIKLYNITLQGATSYVIYVSGDYSQIIDCEIIHPKCTGLKFQYVENGLIQGNNIYTGYTTSTSTVDGIFIQWGSNTIVDDNISNMDAHGGSAHNDCLQANQETNLTIRNNYLIWEGDGAGNADSQTTMITQMYGWLKIYNNICVGNEEKLFQSLYVGYLDTVTYDCDVYIWNNTVYGRASGIALQLDHIDGSLIKAVKNNIFMSGPDGGYAVFFNSAIPSDKSVVDYNVLWEHGYSSGVASDGSGKSWAEWQAAGYDQNGVHQEASLDSNWHIDSTLDPPYNAGVDLSAYFTTDIDGDTRSGTWDIGADEYGTGAPILSNATIAATGFNLTLTFDMNVTQGSGYTDSSDLDVDCTVNGDNIAVAYVSGNGTSIHVYRLSKIVYSSQYDTCNLDWAGTADGLENDSGDDLAEIVSDSITNNSNMHLISKGLTIN